MGACAASVVRAEGGNMARILVVDESGELIGLSPPISGRHVRGIQLLERTPLRTVTGTHAYGVFALNCVALFLVTLACGNVSS